MIVLKIIFWLIVLGILGFIFFHIRKYTVKCFYYKTRDLSGMDRLHWRRDHDEFIEDIDDIIIKFWIWDFSKFIIDEKLKIQYLAWRDA